MVAEPCPRIPEKAAADNAVSRVRGVVDVENMLKVDTGDIFVRDPYVDDWFGAFEGGAAWVINELEIAR